MADIKRLLNKNGWTGQELGIIELTNMALNFQQRLQGKEPKDLIDRAQFQRMLNSITDKEQGRIYNGYIAIHEWLSLHYNIAQTQLQQAQLQFRTLIDYVAQATLAEDVYSYMEQLPAIMTQKQYDEIRAKRIEAQFYDKDGNPLASNVFNLVERAIIHYLHELQKSPQKTNPLKAIRKKYLSQPVKSSLILSRWNEATGSGYYSLPDGRRSDEMTDEEWQAALSPAMREAISEIQTADGGDGQSIVSERLIERAKIIFRGGTEEDADEAQSERERSRGWSTPPQWHYYEDPPQDLTKWDVIEQELLLDFYPAPLDGGDAYGDANFTASMEDFVDEFGELVSVMLKDIDRRFFKDSPGLSELPINKWGSTVYDYRQLYEKDFYSMREEIESDTSIFEGNRRAIFNGIAIMRPSDLLGKSPRIDENGYYVEPRLRSTLSNFTLEAFFPEAEDYADNIEIVGGARDTLLDSYYFLKGYNLALEMIANYYEVPELTAFQMGIAHIEDKIDAFNNLVPVLYRRITGIDYQDKELQAKKLQVLKDLFAEIDYKSLEIPAERITQAKDLLIDFKAFQSDQADTLYNILCIRPQADEEEGGPA